MLVQQKERSVRRAGRVESGLTLVRCAEDRSAALSHSMASERFVWVKFGDSVRLQACIQ